MAQPGNAQKIEKVLIKLFLKVYAGLLRVVKILFPKGYLGSKALS